MAREAGAAWQVEGAYQRLGDRMRVTARLIETATGAVVAGARADGEVGDIFSLQDRIANDLGTALLARASRPDDPAVAAPRRAPLLGDGNGNGTGNRALAGAPRAESAAPSAAAHRDAARRAPGRRTGLPDGAERGAVAAGGNRPPGPGGVGGGVGERRVPGAGFAAAGVLTGRPALRPTRTAVRPDIDGRLDDLVWRNALRVTEFVQESPFEGAPASEDTEVWISYDSQNLYLAFHAHYDDPGILRASRVDRDRAFRDDKIAVYFDPFLDQQRAYAFSVNGYGVQGDEIISARAGGGGGGGGGGFRRQGIPWGDDSWDALFDSGARLVDDGFTAEMAIPFKSLRYPQRGSGVPHRWAFQFVREIRDKDENIVWAPISRGVAGFGRGGGGGMFLTVRPVPRFQSQVNVNSSRLLDPRNDDELVFDVTIVRALSTYQFTDRLALRQIVEFNTLQRTTGLNVLATYRVNAGTVFYLGYDDRYQQGSLILGDDLDGDGIQDHLFPSVTALQRTNRAFFTKFQYLFRY